MHDRNGTMYPTLTVLIAEDNLIPALEIEDIIRDLGCQVVGPVGKLSEVIKLIETTPFDAALLDVELKNSEKVYRLRNCYAHAGSHLRSLRPMIARRSARATPEQRSFRSPFYGASWK